MVRRKAVSSATRLCGASSTGYVSLRGLIGSRPVPSGRPRDPSALVSRRWFECRRRVVHGVLGGPVRRCGRH
eukprot:1697197-Prymnesium_polylepis.1